MAQAKTGIEWTDSTWNPTTGCTEVSAGCDNFGKRVIVKDSAGR